MTDELIKSIFVEIIDAYKKIGFDLSDIKLKIDSQPVYTNGKPSFDFSPDESGGSWTKLGYIQINPNMVSVMKHYGLECNGYRDVVHFAKTIIAHELAHEIYNNIATDNYKMIVLTNCVVSGFTTPYLKTVKPNKIAEETFCEYMANNVVNSKNNNL